MARYEPTFGDFVVHRKYPGLIFKVITVHPRVFGNFRFFDLRLIGGQTRADRDTLSRFATKSELTGDIKDQQLTDLEPASEMVVLALAAEGDFNE